MAMSASSRPAPVSPVPRPKAMRSSLRKDAVNVPNLLTMLRIVLIPAVLYLISLETPVGNFWATMVYSLCAVTDFIDGWLARRMGLISVLGKFLDPLADKLLVMASLVAMVGMSRAPAWAVIVIVARELSITSLRVIAMSEGVTIAANQSGKEKAALQMVAILFLIIHHAYYLNFGLFTCFVDFHTAGMLLLYLSVFFTVTSGGEYVALFVEAVEQKEKRLAES
jgi:CDP-diacylglycerol---glycerol-3-phosphate 3-phosphatidyltransferase